MYLIKRTPGPPGGLTFGAIRAGTQPSGVSPQTPVLANACVDSFFNRGAIDPVSDLTKLLGRLQTKVTRSEQPGRCVREVTARDFPRSSLRRVISRGAGRPLCASRTRRAVDSICRSRCRPLDSFRRAWRSTAPDPPTSSARSEPRHPAAPGLRLRC
jgi:hypothetical protein